MSAIIEPTMAEQLVGRRIFPWEDEEAVLREWRKVEAIRRLEREIAALKARLEEELSS